MLKSNENEMEFSEDFKCGIDTFANRFASSASIHDWSLCLH